MKTNNLIVSIIILPILFGIAFGTVFTVTAKQNVSRIVPFIEGTQFAFHDKLKSSDNMVEFDGDLSTLKSNDYIGTIKILGNNLNIKYDCDYSNMISSLSMNKQNSHFGDVGCVYLRAFSDSAKVLEGETEIDIESVFGTYKYKLIGQHKSDNEFKILSTAPPVSKALVIYYQISDGAGLSSKYNVLVYEEVE